MKSPTMKADNLCTTIHEEEELDDWESWDPMTEDYKSAKNNLASDPNVDPESMFTGEVMSTNLGKKEICEHYIKYGSCADGEYCDRLHVTPQARDKLLMVARNFELNKNRTCLTYNFLSPVDIEPDPDKLLMVTVAQITSPTDFVFIAPYELMDFSHFNQEEFNFYIDRVNQTSSYKTKLEKCHEQLAALFDHEYRLDNLNDDIHLSQIVACKLQDGRFCRAMVVETDDLMEDRFEFKLYLIDIGIVVERPREMIYDIRANCLSEPPMAISARLDVKPKNGQVTWPDEVLAKFKDKISSKKYLLCKVVEYQSYDRTFTVDLLDIRSKASFTEKMVQCGLADSCKCNVISSGWDDL